LSRLLPSWQASEWPNWRFDLAALPLERIVAALEEMEQLALRLQDEPSSSGERRQRR